MKIGEFFAEYNRLLILAAMLTMFLMAALLGAPVAATPAAGGGASPF